MRVLCDKVWGVGGFSVKIGVVARGDGAYKGRMQGRKLGVRVSEDSDQEQNVTPT
ncbi:MAG: hypothetical protein JWP44_4946 [Mucilaginibacter sp.]|nr:hypothetical protein [Mucilaginibacter sp.]